MENRHSLFFKLSNILIVLVIISTTLLFILPLYTIVTAETATSWNYPSDWTKIGGDQDFVAIRASGVYESEYVGSDTNYRESGAEHTSVTIEKVQQSGDPTIYVRRTFLKGFFENNWYIAVLVDLEMDPGNNYQTNCKIRSANALIQTHIYKATKLGSLIVTYWPTTILGGRYAAGAPLAAMDSTTQSIGVDAGFQGKTISGSFTIAYSNTTPRLSIRGANLKTNDIANGFQSRYLYYKPYENNVAYTESKSVLKYVAIYRCDSAVEYYDIKVETRGEFFYDSPGLLENAIVRANASKDFFMKPSTGFYKVY